MEELLKDLLEMKSKKVIVKRIKKAEKLTN